MFKDYKYRQHVTFHDENQCEVRGVVLQEDRYDDRIILLIELDNDEGYYSATLMKRQNERTYDIA